MSATRTSSTKRGAAPTPSQKAGLDDGDGLDLDVSSDLKGILSSFQQIRKDDQNKVKEKEKICRLSSGTKSMIDELKSKVQKERQTFAKALLKSSNECENWLNYENAKFQEIYDQFRTEKASHILALKDTVSEFEEEKAKLKSRYEQLKERMILEQETFFADKTAQLEPLKKKHQEDKTFASLGSF